jgi:hypothetical protein
MQNLTVTATGMRQTLEQRSVKIPIKRTIQWSELRHVLDIPDDLLAYEPSRTRSRAIDIWRTQVLQTMSELIRTRKSLGMNKNMRFIVFRSGMENLLIRFNMFTENLKVEFRECHHVDTFASITYYLDFILLSSVPDSIRNAPSCIAEIPEPTAQAEFFMADSDNSDDVVVVGEIVQETTGQQSQTQSHSCPSVGDFCTINTRETGTNQSDEIPVVVATTVDSISSECISHDPISRVSELDRLRREVDELRGENALLRSQAATSPGNSELVSPEFMELQQEMAEMRQMLRHMMELMSLSQQKQQMSDTTTATTTNDTTSTI